MQATGATARTHSRAASLAAALAGGTLISYGFSAQEAAHAEAPAAPPAASDKVDALTGSLAMHASRPGHGHSTLCCVSHHPDKRAASQVAAIDPYKLPEETHGLPKSVVLYQYEVCPFCCKVKAFLDYHNIPYRVVEVNPLTKAELKWSEYKKVPVVLLDGREQLNDSSAIISRLAAEVHAGQGAGAPRKGWFSRGSSSAASASASSTTEEERWRRWVDERLVRVITVNIYRNARESWQTFDYIADHGNFCWVQREAARVAGATIMWSLSGRLKKKYKVDGDVRQALYACAEEWVQALAGRPFLGGEAPNLADLAVFGVMRSVVGTDTFMDLQHKTAIAPWYERMMGAVGAAARLREVEA